MIKKHNILLILFMSVFLGNTQVDYDTDVLPIFQVSCTGCHGFDGGGFNGGLDLTSEEGVLSGSNNGSVVIYGDYLNSLLYQEINSENMPPFWSGNPTLTIAEIDVVVSWIEGLSDGCTDPTALNFDENAINDDGSCEYAPWDVTTTDCNMTVAIPSDLTITLNGESIDEPVWIGVVNENGDVTGATLYTPGITTSIAVWGQSGTDPGMIAGENLNWLINLSGLVGTVTLVEYDFGEEIYSCNGLSSINLLSAISEQVVDVGCTDELACNYNVTATDDDGSCLYVDGVCETCSGETDGTGSVIDNDLDDDGVCDDDEIFGCTDETACNYMFEATEDDGFCIYFDECGVCDGDNTLCLGCTDGGSTENGDGIIACNYGGDSITIDDGSCEYVSCLGCLDPVACNYNSSATIDGECFYPEIGFDCDGQAYTCGDVINFMSGPFELAGNNYYISGDDYTWDEANQLAISYGFYLLTINSQEEQDFIESLINVDLETEFWIGLYQNIESETYVEPDGGWEWITGEPLNYLNWAADEPNNFGTVEENFGLLSYLFSSWNWNDQDQDSGLYFFIMECGDLFNTLGCTDEIACNYNPNATEDDGSCEFLDGICETCENGIVIDNDEDEDGICDNEETEGCLDELACNYNVIATNDDGSCIYVNESSVCDECSGEIDGTGFVIDNDSDNDGLCDDEDPCPEDPDNDTNNNGIFDCEEIIGCTNPDACNYNPEANTDDGSCELPDGCTDVIACNYDPEAVCDDGSCELPDGCTNPNACNYDPEAICDDGSCDSSSCVGCIDPLACNYCPDCTISLVASCDYDTCCDDPTATNYDTNCLCPSDDSCFNIPNDCNFDCFPSGEGIYPIPITSSYGAYEISCFGASDGVLSIDFNTMNLVSSGEAPYFIQVYQQIDSNQDGVIDIDEEIFIGTLDESSPTFDNLIAGNYVLIAYDVNGCCGQTLVSMNEPGENTLVIPDYQPIACPDGQTEIDFIIEGAVGQFDVTIDDLLYAESVDGGTVTVSSIDSDLDGVPDDFIQLNTSFYFNENFWPELYNECDGNVNTIYINIENDEDIEDGDLIGAFYTTGEGTLQSFGYNTYMSSTSGSSLLTIQICEGGDNGFNNGEEVIFLVYDSSEGLIYEVEVVYEYNTTTGTFSDVFTVDPTYDGIWISSLSIVGESGSVPDFSLIVEEGAYNIQINRTDSIDSDNDGILDDAFICSVVDTIINVFDPDPLSVDVMLGGTICNYLEDGDVVSTPGGYIELENFTGGTPPYTYTWYNPSLEIIEQNFTFGLTTLADFDGDDILDDLDFLPAGIYSLNVLDANGCIFDLEVELEGSDIQLGEVVVEYVPIACSGGSTTVNVFFDGNQSESYLFEWLDTEGNTLDLSVDFDAAVELEQVIEGSYTLVLTDASGCSISEDVDVDVDPSGQLAIFNPFIELICDGTEAFVSFSDCPTGDGSCVTNGTPPFNYTWYLMEDLNDDGVLETSTDLGYPETVSSTDLEFGTYVFSVTDFNGCTGETMFTISPPEPIEFQPLIDSIVCFGDSATISLEIIQGNPGLYDFIFEGDTTTITIGGGSELDFLIDTETGIFDGSFVTDVNATLLFNDVSIFSPNDIIGVFYTGEDGITCGGSSIYNGESVFSIAVWGDDSSTTEDDGFDVDENLLILLNSGGIVYEVQILNFDNIFDSPFSYVPNGLSAITDVEVGDEFSQGPNFVTDPLVPGNYFIEVYDGNECYWSELITIDGVDEYYLSSSILNPICDEEGSGEIFVEVFGGTVSTGYSFVWTSPDIIGFSVFESGFFSNLIELEPAEYSLTVFDDNDCILTESFFVELDTPEPSILISDELCGEDASISICVDWEGEIEFSLSSSGGVEQNVILFNDTDQLCYNFIDLFNSIDEGLYTLSISGQNSSLDNEGCFYLQEDIFIEAAEAIEVEFFTEDAECNGGTGSVWITLLDGGNPPYEIDWQGISTESTPVGFHQFVITDANGCEYSQSYAIQNTTSIEVDFDVVDNDCFGETNGIISFNISGGNEEDGYVYQMYNGLSESILSGFGSSASLSNLSAGFYNLVVEDASGCIISVSEEIIDLSPEILFEEINISPPLCYGEEGIVSLNLLDTLNSDFLYHWYQLSGPDWDVDNDGILNSEDFSIDGGTLLSNEIGFSSQVSLLASNYFVFVESIQNSCFSDTLLFQVESPDVFMITVEDVLLSCFGDVVSVNPIVFGGSDSDIDGDGINNNDEFGNWIDPDIDGDGVYDIDGECLSNCNDDDIDIDNDGILNDLDDYIGGTIFNGLSTNSAPSFSNGLIFENEFGDEVDPNSLGEGTYNVYAFDSNGCLSTVEEFVIDAPLELNTSLSYDYNAEGIIQEVSGDIEILCFGDSIAMVIEPYGGTPPYIINCFNVFDVPFDVTNTMFSSGDYYVSIIDSENCEFTSSFTILNQPEPLELDYILSDYNDFNISCYGETDGSIDISVVGGVGDYTYSWSNGSNEEDLSILGAGIYSILITDENGCELNEFIELIEPSEFSPEIEYVVNASCDEESDGVIIIRTSGGNPPFSYTVDNSPEIFTTYDTLLVVSEDMSSDLIQYQDDYVEEIMITESDIFLTDLDGNSWHTISILNDDYSCLDGVGPIGYSIYVGSNDDNCLFIPSVFTPNGDGINDTWQMDGMDLYPNATIRVFNRWGQIVFESLEKEYVPWDGISSKGIKDQEIATYYYVIDLNIDNKNYNGSVTIKR